ncbi:MAG TPA: hypothetical protein VFB15_12375 [Candidatus Binataceae bacterium]|nr:hypothetical protein [Candidatus Binataceae bacterium]
MHNITVSRMWSLVAIVAACGCAKPLPEAASPAAQLYASRCGSCHRPYAPESLTPSMWRVQLEAMEPKMAEAGLPPLSAAQQQQILSYLQRHAQQPQ